MQAPSIMESPFSLVADCEVYEVIRALTVKNKNATEIHPKLFMVKT